MKNERLNVLEQKIEDMGVTEIPHIDDCGTEITEKKGVWKKVRRVLEPFGKLIFEMSLKEPIAEVIDTDGTVRMFEDVHEGVYYVGKGKNKTVVFLTPSRMVSWRKEKSISDFGEEKWRGVIRGWIVDLKSGMCPPFDDYIDSETIFKVQERIKADRDALKFDELGTSLWDKAKPFILPIAIIVIALVAFSYLLTPAKPPAEAVKPLVSAVNSTKEFLGNITVIKP